MEPTPDLLLFILVSIQAMLQYGPATSYHLLESTEKVKMECIADD
jgi:hypothetical protein